MFISLLGTKGRYGQAGLKAVLKESIGHPLLSISPLVTKLRDAQVGQKTTLIESIEHTLLSIDSLGTQLMGWISKTGSIKGVCRTFVSVN